jgi:hypothetical protein
MVFLSGFERFYGVFGCFYGVLGCFWGLVAGGSGCGTAVFRYSGFNGFFECF